MKKIILYILSLTYFIFALSAQAAGPGVHQIDNSSVQRLDTVNTPKPKNPRIVPTHPPRLITYGSSNFRKIGGNGRVLLAPSKNWACVLDKSTGLTWEKKHPSYGPRWWNTQYTNTSNDSHRPTKKRGRCEYVPGEANLQKGEMCHTQGYVEILNTFQGSGLCGYTNWRMPTLAELRTILKSMPGYPDRITGFIDRLFFPYPEIHTLWTGDDFITQPRKKDDAGETDLGIGRAMVIRMRSRHGDHRFSGVIQAVPRYDLYPIILVRGGR